MGTSSTGDDAKPLKTDRRVKLDGGLNTRSSAPAVQADQAQILRNLRFLTSGALQKRKGGSLLKRVNYVSSVPSGLPPPSLSHNAASGTFVAGTYEVGYVYSVVNGFNGSDTIIGLSQTASIVLNNNDNLVVLVMAPNSGDGVGLLASPPTTFPFSFPFNDTPQNGGLLLRNGSNFGVYVKKLGDPNFTLQVATSVVDGGVGTLFGRVFTLASYTNNGAIAPSGSNAPVAIRDLSFHPLIDTMIGLSLDTPWALRVQNIVGGGGSTIEYLNQNLSLDANARAVSFSRAPVRVSTCIFDRIMIKSDGIGRPKILDTPADNTQQFSIAVPTSWSFRQLGCLGPSNAPTLGAPIGGPGLTGTYMYAVTWVFKRNRQDGTSFFSESNPSPTSTSGILANQQQPVTQPAGANENGIVSWNIYRSNAGGTQLFLTASLPILTTAFNDNIPDASQTGQNAPSLGGRLSNGIPPYGLNMVTEFNGRLFGVQSYIVRQPFLVSSQLDFSRVRHTNILWYSQARFQNDLVSINGFITTDPGDYGNMDAWPPTFQFPCGNASPITNVISFRGVLYVFKEDEIGVVEGDGDTGFSYRTIWTGSGAMEYSVIPVGNYLMAFDQAMGPIIIRGYSVEHIGYDAIQIDWETATNSLFDATFEIVTGGGRGTTSVVSKIWDTVNSEVRWVISDYSADPTSATAAGNGIQNIVNGGVFTQPGFFEYVCQVPKNEPSGQFTRFTGTVSNIGFGPMADRRILGQCNAVTSNAAAAYRARDVVYGDYHGRLCADYQSEQDLADVADPLNLGINFTALLPFYFGDDVEMVKQFRYLYTMTTVGTTATDKIVFTTQSITKGANSPAAQLQVSGNFNPGLNRLLHTPLTANIDGAGDNAERGIQVLITGTAKSGPTLISEVTLKYQDRGYRSKP